MNLVLILSISVIILGPFITTGGVYYFKKDVLKLYDEYCTNSPITRRVGRAARVLPLSNYPVAPKKEIELVDLPKKKYVIVQNPDDNIAIGSEITMK
jgi:hypothetical protein